MSEYVVRPSALPPPAIASLRDGLLASPLVGPSTLTGSFKYSRGFALTFKREALESVCRRFALVGPFLDLVLGDEDELAGIWERLRLRSARVSNAFYLNVLLLSEGGGVGRHTDATLRGPSGDKEALPKRVSVLYLDVPECRAGGRLGLYRGDKRVGEISPQPGTLVHFRGDLQHEVTPLEGAATGALRMSLVCEQYVLGEKALAQLPSLHVQSRAGFDAFLALRRGEPQDDEPRGDD